MGGLAAFAALVGALSSLSVALISATCTHINEFVVFWLILSKWVCRFLGGLAAFAALVGALSGLGYAPMSATCTRLNRFVVFAVVPLYAVVVIRRGTH